MSGGSDVLVPLFSRLRLAYKKMCCKTSNKKGNNNKPHHTTVQNPSQSGSSVIQNCKDSGLGIVEREGKQNIDSLHPPPSNSSPQTSGRENQPPFPLQRDGVRVLLFRECDTRGRKLLYDSKTVVQVPLSDASSTAVPSCKTLFKASWGVSGTSLGGSGAQQRGTRSTGNIKSSPASKTSGSSSAPGNVKSSSASKTSGWSSKPDVYAEVSKGYGYQYLQQESDTKTVGDLVFGTVALAYRGSCSKLHLLHDPHRLLLSRTAPAPAPASHLRHSAPSSDAGIEAGSIGSSVSSLYEGGVSRADSLEVPWGPGRSLAWEVPRVLSSTISEGDSGIGGPPSPYSSTCGSFLSPPSLPSTPHGTPSSRQGSGSSLKNSGSLNSLQRRFLRNVTTSLEALGEVGGGSGGGGSGGEDSGGSGGGGQHPHRRATKLGIAVIIQLGGSGRTQLDRQVEEWLFLHLGVVEGAVERLQGALDWAYLHRHTFVSATHHAVTRLQQDIVDLTSGARLCRPVWLGLGGASGAVSGERQALSSLLVHTLASVLHTHDTKTTNFFVSKLLTAVLTHHLGWVSTVAPSDPPQPSTTTTTTTTPPQHPSWVERLCESHPYSAVWAQLCELSGAVGYPPHTARTILLGSDTTLLQQLLTILSYVIRCSQVVEQEVEPDTTDPQQPQPQQSGYSRTSSMASIVTVVEGGRKDSQREFSSRDNNSCCSTRQNSLVQLQRESSIRRSWRKNRESRGSRLVPAEVRVESNDGTKDDPVTQADPNAPQRSTRREGDQASKWMLNDGEEIVISDAKGGDKVPLETRGGQDMPTGGKSKEGITVPLSATKDIMFKSSDNTAKTLSTCKTSTNLASLVGDDDLVDNIPEPSFSEGISLSATKGASERLYPTLYDLDDHRETFGPVTLEPVVIAEKVQKLFRGSVKQTSPCEGEERTVCYQSSQPCLTQETGHHIPENISDSKPPPAISATTLPRTKKSQSAAVGIGFKYEFAEVHEGVNVSIKDIHGARIRSQVSGITNGAAVRVPAKDIHPEVEEGGKILLLGGEGEELNPLERTTRGPKLADQRTKDKVDLSVGIGFESLNHTLILFDSSDKLTCLPSPIDNRRLVRMRNVGRESVQDLTTLEKKQAFYPSLSQFKQDLRLPGKLEYIDDLNTLAKTHRRHHSDPTNGLFVTRLMKPDVGDPLNDLAEENVTDKRESALEISIEVPSIPHKLVRRKSEDPDKSRRNSENEDMEVKKEGEKKDVVETKSEGSQEEMSEVGIPTDSSIPDISKEPVAMPMPRCESRNGKGWRSVNLGASLLGGVLDHYSSVFVLHASTQTHHHWADTLRGDLHTAAHRPTLDQPIAEAVAVVANTDSWEVEVVSSHSYVVDRGGGCVSGAGGVHVGMSPLVSSITDSILHLTRLNLDPVYIVQHLEERLSELYLKSQLLASYLLEGAGVGSGGGGSGVSGGGSSGVSSTTTHHHLPDLTRALGLDLNDLPLLLAVASTHTPELTRMFGLSFR